MLFKLAMGSATCDGLQMRRSALLALTLGCASCLRTPCEQDGLCLVTTSVALRPSDSSLASADIDGDGHLDVVTVGGFGVALRRGHGDGSLAVPTVWTLPTEAVDLALGDLDGDGLQELVTTFPSRGSLAWLPGTVGGWDAAPRELEVGADVQALLAADLDGDGADELITSERHRGRLHLWMGAAAGPGASRYIDIGGEAVAMVAGDFVAGAGLELAVAIPSLGVVERRAFSPTVGLAHTGTAWTSAFPASLVVADLDPDGRDDLAGIDSLDRTLWIGLGDGAGGWHREHSWPLAETPNQVFARRGPTGPELGIISGDRNGVTLIDPFTGAARIEAVAAGWLRSVVAGDFVAGGSEELVYLHGSVRIVEELAGYRAQPLWTAPASGLTGVVAVVDLDGDEVPELIAEELSQSALVVFAGAGKEYLEVARHPLSGALDGLRALARDDGGADLVWWQRELVGTPSPLGVLTYTPGAGLAEVATMALDEPILDIIAADHDGDGWPDLAVTVDLGDEYEQQALVFVMREPDGGLTSGPRVLEGAYIDAVVAAQIDGAAGEDLWVIGQGMVRSVLGGAVTPMGMYFGTPGWSNATFMAADLDGDAQADMVICDAYGGASVAAGHPDGTLGYPVELATGSCDRLTACDLDADGDLDLVRERQLAGGLRGAVEVHRADPDGWRSTGAFADAPNLLQTATACHGSAILQWSGTTSGGTLRGVVTGPALREAELPVHFARPAPPADLNGDGLDDLFVNDRDSPTLGLALADGEGGFHSVQQLAMPLAAGHTLLTYTTAELDGRPGKELVVVISTPGIEGFLRQIWSLRAGQLVTLASLATFALAGGDFDGDGVDELLFGPDSGPQPVWPGVDGAKIRTVDLDPALLDELAGLRVADIDGDGMDDLLVTRLPDAGTIEVLRSGGDGTFEAPRPWRLERDGYTNLDNLGIGDVDADGKVDLVVFDYPGRLTIGHGDGEGSMLAVSEESHDLGILLTIGVLGVSVRGAPLVDDLDGDGRAEVALLLREYGQPDMLRVIRPGSASEPTPWPLDGVTSSDAVVRMQLTADTPAWAVIGYQGVVIVTAEGGT